MNEHSEDTISNSVLPPDIQRYIEEQAIERMVNERVAQKLKEQALKAKEDEKQAKKESRAKEQEQRKESAQYLMNKFEDNAITRRTADNLYYLYFDPLKKYIEIPDDRVLSYVWSSLRSYLSLSQAKELMERVVLKAARSQEIDRAARFYSPPGRPDLVYFDLGDNRCVLLGDGKPQLMDHPDSFVFVEQPTGKLPKPDLDGTWQDLRKYLGYNLTKKQFALIVGWMSNVFNLRGPNAMLSIHGGNGSCKSTTSQKIIQLVDPHNHFRFLDEDVPDDPRDLVAQVVDQGVFHYSNLDSVRKWLSDSLCKIVTGRTSVQRKLHSNHDKSITSVRMNGIINSVNFVLDEKDAQRRTISIELVRPVENIREERIQELFEEEQPKALGALLNIVSTAMQNKTTVDTFPHDPSDTLNGLREWAERGATECGWKPGEFTEVFNEARIIKRDEPSYADMFIDALIKFMVTIDRIEWKGVHTEIAKFISFELDDEFTYQRLSGAFRKLKSRLTERGVSVKLINARKQIGHTLEVRVDERVFKGARVAEGLDDGDEPTDESTKEPKTILR